jgi:hypothetical protein
VDRTPEEAAMGITREIPAGEPFELAGRIVGLERETGRAVLVERSSSTWRIDGYTIKSSQAPAIPRGTWHRIIVDEPGQLINVTPGPGGQHRSLREA